MSELCTLSVLWRCAQCLICALCTSVLLAHMQVLPLQLLPVLLLLELVLVVVMVMMMMVSVLSACLQLFVQVVEMPKAKPPPARPPKLSECSPLFMAVRDQGMRSAPCPLEAPGTAEGGLKGGVAVRLCAHLCVCVCVHTCVQAQACVHVRA